MTMPSGLATNMRAGDLLAGVADAGDLASVNLRGLELDSRNVRPGDAFVALRGSIHHGIEFAEAARAAGAVLVLAEGPAPQEPTWSDGVLWIDGLAAQLGKLAARLYGDASRTLKVTGITGTNGKTSSVQMLTQALELLGERAGSIGTLGAGLYGDIRPGARTTPDVITVQRLLAEQRAAGASHVAMEVSSHALAQGRVDGVHFFVAAFTNLTRDHLDYHGSMDAYGAAKAKLFRWPELAHAVINVDDPFGSVLASQVVAETCVLRVSARGLADSEMQAADIATTANGLTFSLRAGGKSGQVNSLLLGRFNVANLLIVAGCLLALGFDFDEVVSVLSKLEPIRGRMQRLGGSGQPLVVVDYAHTPDALEQALDALRSHCVGRLWCVFGCGGERDSGKRPLMGAVAARLADECIITDDNPRSEDGDSIAAAIRAGMPASTHVTVQRDRARAIEHAVRSASPRDVILVAGKGHETQQEARGQKHPFDDVAVARLALGAPQC